MEQKVHIVLIEDNDMDALIANHMLLNVDKDCKITRLINGQEGIDYLKENDLMSPMVIVLDLNMPLMDGYEFLEEIKKSRELKKLTISVLSSSSRPEDIALCEDLGISKYFIKPLTLASCQEIINLAKAA